MEQDPYDGPHHPRPSSPPIFARSEGSHLRHQHLALADVVRRRDHPLLLHLLDQAVAIVAKDRKCSTSYIQRKLSVGYNKAAKLVEMMEEQGVVSQANHVGKREVLVPER